MTSRTHSAILLVSVSHVLHCIQPIIQYYVATNSRSLRRNLYVRYSGYIQSEIDKTLRKLTVCETLLITHNPHFAPLTTWC